MCGGDFDEPRVAGVMAITDRFMLGGHLREIGLVAAFLVILLTIRWQRHSKMREQMKRNNSGLLRIARASSAASLATLKQVSSSPSFVRLSEAVRKLQCFKQGYSVPTLSAPEMFAPLTALKKISLQELSTVINYAMECNRSGFDEAPFLAALSPHGKEIVAAMDTAVIKSRGVHVLPSEISAPVRDGDVDALYFCAAMRLLVEWRAVKIIPAEYKSYAVGMNVAKRDLVQNTAKVEDAIHKWIESEVESGKEEVSSPTVRQLLDYELTSNVHTRLPKLKDNTAATGIVWMNRQLLFQTEIFANMLKVPNTYKTGIEAVRAAYKTVFNPYHGWAIQQVFNYSFNGAPPVSVLFEMMNPEVMDEIENYFPETDTEMVDYSVPEAADSSFTSSLDNSTHSHNEDLVSHVSSKEEDLNPFERFGRDTKKNWEKFAADVERDWSAFVEVLVQCGSKDNRVRAHSLDTSVAGVSDFQSDPGVQKERPSLRRRPSVPKFVLNEDGLQQYVERETTKAAHKHIDSYLTIMKPLLTELTTTIEEFGMNDPSKV
jgi:hypothetical protein